MPTEVLANNASTTLNANVATTPAAGTLETWTLASTALFPQIGTGGTQQFRGTVGPTSDTNPEIVIVTQIISSTSIQVSRGAEGSPIKTHAIGDPFIGTLTVAGLAAFAAQNGRPNPTVFISSGTYTIPAGASLLQIETVGGGGAGASMMSNFYSGGGGGAGQYTSSLVPVGVNTTLSVVIGAGGAAVSVVGNANHFISTVAAATGSPGGVTSVTGTGINVSAGGGSPGQASSAGNNGSSGGFPGYTGAMFTITSTADLLPPSLGQGGWGNLTGSSSNYGQGGGPAGRAAGGGGGGAAYSTAAGGGGGGYGLPSAGGAAGLYGGSSTGNVAGNGSSAPSPDVYGNGAGAGGGGAGGQASGSLLGNSTNWTTGGTAPACGFAGATGSSITLSNTWESIPALGDLLLAWVYCNAVSSTLIGPSGGPSGWTLVNRSSPNNAAGCYALYFKYAAAADQASPPNYVFSGPTGNWWATVWGAVGAAALDGGVNVTQQTVATTAFSVPSLTPTTPGDLQMAFLGASSAPSVSTNASGFTTYGGWNTPTMWELLPYNTSASPGGSGGVLGTSSTFTLVTFLLQSSGAGGSGAPGAAWITVVA